MNANLFRKAILGAILSAGIACAKTSAIPVTDEQLAGKVLHEIRMYPRYSIFDDIKFRVSNGNVALVGEVNQPIKKSDLGSIISRLNGVAAVDNELKVAPLSDSDDRIRRQVANAIYRDPVLSRYGLGSFPSIHIIVDSGHVTLEGVVDNETAKQIAGIRANSSMSFGSITNNLQVTQPESIRATSKRG